MRRLLGPPPAPPLYPSPVQSQARLVGLVTAPPRPLPPAVAPSWPPPSRPPASPWRHLLSPLGRGCTSSRVAMATGAAVTVVVAVFAVLHPAVATVGGGRCGIRHEFSARPVRCPCLAWRRSRSRGATSCEARRARHEEGGGRGVARCRRDTRVGAEADPNEAPGQPHTRLGRRRKDAGRQKRGRSVGPGWREHGADAELLILHPQLVFAW